MKEKSKAKKIIAKDGVEIYYWITSDTNQKKDFAVLHPGASMNHSCLEEFEAGLNQRSYPTLIMDPRGWGYSKAVAKKELYQLDNFSSDLEQILKTEGIENPLLIGHSLGFMPVADYASRSKNAKKVFAICSSYNFKETFPNRLLFPLIDGPFRYTEYAGSVIANINHFFNGEKRGYNDQSGKKNDWDMWLSIVDVPFSDVNQHIVSGREITKMDISDQLKQIEKPLVLIYGENDILVSPKAGYHIRDTLNVPCKIEIMDANHSLPMYKTKELLKVMDKYL